MCSGLVDGSSALGRRHPIPVGSHSIPDLRIESKQELSGFALMTSRTPSSLETGFSGVLFIENRIFRTPPPPPLRKPRSMVPLHELKERASDQTSPRLEFISHIRASRRPAVCSRPAAVRRLQSYRLAATVRLPQSDESRTGSNRSAVDFYPAIRSSSHIDC